ncbi:MAG TPA: isoaspartyl peptidase/L-asparaginase [Candidatus Thermoplasmatota archaeon]|nr:isoaspartyl peptidase/L-asparaginase [Candidatus Thermoplasmatota archaeon]
MVLTAVTHGGAASLGSDKDGPEEAARLALKALRGGASPLDAAVAAVAHLEDDPRFNAGTGSNLRFDGKTIEMDAACMDDTGRFGGVACIREVKNPVHVARAVLRTPHNLLAGHGATRFARSLGMEPYDPWTERAQAKFDLLRRTLREKGIPPEEWDMSELRNLWNFEVEITQALGSSDTVGAVVSDGRRHAAALSTGGTISTLLGRVGDVPLPGCGLYAGPRGAVACTGDGDRLTRVFLGHRVYRMLEEGLHPKDCVGNAIGLLAPEVDVGLIVVSGDQHAGGSNRDMAWAALQEDP